METPFLESSSPPDNAEQADDQIGGNLEGSDLPVEGPDQETSEAVDNQSLAASADEKEQHLIDLVLTLFDQTQALHELGADSRLAIQSAALLAYRDIPHSKKKPYQATREVVKQQFSSFLNSEEHDLAAGTLAFYRGKIKKKDFNTLEFSPNQQRQILTLSALLCIATGLNDSHSQQTTIQHVDIERNSMWIVVDGPAASSDAAVAQLNCKLWTKIGYPEVEVIESAEAAIRRLPFPEPQEKIGLKPSDSLAEAGRKVMRFHFSQMLVNEPGTRLGEDIEALHDMRVASRRLRAAFEVFEQAFEPGALKYYLKGLRATGRALGEVRDLDVFMEKAVHYLETLETDHQHDLDLLLDTWREQRKEARTRMLTYLDSQEYDEFKHKFNIFLNTPGAGVRITHMDQPIPTLVCELAPVLIYTRFAEVRAFNPILAEATIEQLHALRIEFKKLRYSVEYFREVLGKSTQDVITDIKRVQDHLGDLNDAQVATQILREFIDQWEPRLNAMPIHERPNLEPLVQYLAARHAERHQLMNSFLKTWSYINRSRFRRNLAQSIAIL